MATLDDFLPQASGQIASAPKKLDDFLPQGSAPSAEADSNTMPGIGEAALQGLQRSIGDVGQSISFNTNRAPETSAAAQDLGWRDVLEPINRLAPKLSYRLAQGSPVLAFGLAGMGLGSVVDPGVGTAIGGIGGAAAGAAIQTIGPSFAAELKQTPNDPDGAWTRAMEHAAISGAFSGAGWALFPAKFFDGPVKQLAFQAFGVQPSVSVAEQATQNVVSGKPLTENLGRAYTEGVAGTAVPAVGHSTFRGALAAGRTGVGGGSLKEMAGSFMDSAAGDIVRDAQMKAAPMATFGFGTAV